MGRPRRSCGCALGCLGLAALPVLIVLKGLNLATAPPEEARPAKVFAPAQVKQAERHIEAAQQTAKRAAAHAKAGRREPFTITLTEDDLNAYITSDPATRDQLTAKGVEGAHVTLGDGDVAFEGSVPIWNRRIWVQALGPLRAGPRGQIYFDPQRMQLGRLKWALPASVQERFAAQVKSQAKGRVFHIPGEIESLKVTPGKLEVKAHSDPAALEAGPSQDAAPTRDALPGAAPKSDVSPGAPPNGGPPSPGG